MNTIRLLCLGVLLGLPARAGADDQINMIEIPTEKTEKAPVVVVAQPQNCRGINAADLELSCQRARLLRVAPGTDKRRLIEHRIWQLEHFTGPARTLTTKAKVALGFGIGFTAAGLAALIGGIVGSKEDRSDIGEALALVTSIPLSFAALVIGIPLTALGIKRLGEARRLRMGLTLAPLGSGHGLAGGALGLSLAF